MMAEMEADALARVPESSYFVPAATIVGISFPVDVKLGRFFKQFFFKNFEP